MITVAVGCLCESDIETDSTLHSCMECRVHWCTASVGTHIGVDSDKSYHCIPVHAGIVRTTTAVVMQD